MIGNEAGQYNGVETGRATYNSLSVLLPLYGTIMDKTKIRSQVYQALVRASLNINLERYVEQSMHLLVGLWDANNDGKSVQYMQQRFLPAIIAIAESLRNQPNMLNVINMLESTPKMDVTVTITHATSMYGGNGAVSVLGQIANMDELSRTIRGGMLVNIISSLADNGMIRVADNRNDYLKGAIFQGLFNGMPKNPQATFAYLENMILAVGDFNSGAGFVASPQKIAGLFNRF